LDLKLAAFKNYYNGLSLSEIRSAGEIGVSEPRLRSELPVKLVTVFKEGGRFAAKFLQKDGSERAAAQLHVEGCPLAIGE